MITRGFLGHHHTERTKRKISESNRGRHLSQETKNKMSLAKTGHEVTPEHRKKISDANKGRPSHMTQETKKKISDANKGKTAWNKGKHPSDAIRRKYSESHKGLPSRRKGKHLPEEHRRRISEARRNQWADTEFAKRMIRSLHLKPNNKEQQLASILNELYPDHFRFVGDGQLIIGGFCPDFANINGRKQIIELNGEFWHSQKITGRSKQLEEQRKVQRYAQFGYSTLIIWEHELKELEGLKEKISNFVEQESAESQGETLINCLYE